MRSQIRLHMWHPSCWSRSKNSVRKESSRYKQGAYDQTKLIFQGKSYKIDIYQRIDIYNHDISRYQTTLLSHGKSYKKDIHQTSDI